MRFGYFALCLAIPSVVACGDSPDQSVSGVFPSSAFLGRQVRVEVTGDVTDWDDGVMVSFGDGVTVNKVSVASPTALFADITVADDAAPGLRDVTVDKKVLHEAFQLESAVTLKLNGTPAQGSIATFAINNHDFDTPFDDTSTGDGLFTPLEYTNLFITTPAGVRFDVSSITAYSITGTAFFDIDAAAGPLIVNSGLDADQVKSSLGVDLAVAARTATPLAANTPVMGMVSAPFASTLYEFTPAQMPALATFGTTSASMAAAPGVAILPASGSFDNLISYGTSAAVIQQAPGKLYAVYFDNGGGSGYTYTVRANSQMMTAVAEAEPNNANASAPLAAMTSPYLMTNATLSSEADVDVINVTIATGDIGKKIHVMTTGGDPMTDTVVEVFKPNDTTFGGPSKDTGFHENHLSPVIPAAGAGVYHVKVTASQGFFDDAHNAYVVGIWLE